MHRGSVLDLLWVNVFIHGSGKDNNGKIWAFVVDRNMKVLRNITDDRINIQRILKLNMSDVTR